MICLICDKDYVSVAMHVKAHGMTARNYKFQFDIPLGTPLEDNIVTESRSKHQKSVVSEDYMKSMTDKAEYQNKGKRRREYRLPICSRNKIIEGGKVGVVKAAAMNKINFISRNKDFIRQNKNLILDGKKGMRPLELQHKYGISKVKIMNHLWDILK